MVWEKEGARREEKRCILAEGLPPVTGEGGSTIKVSGKRLRHHSAQESAEAPDIGGDTGTSSDDDVEDETFPGQFELRRHRRTGSDDIESDEAMDEHEEDEEEEEYVDAMDEDEDDQGRLKIMPPT
jgi:hypothetical protein